MVEFPGVDHYPWIGNADVILDVVEEFITGARPTRRSKPSSVGVTALSSREREVARLTIAGLTAPQIADRLAISKRTVQTHIEHAYTKLGVRTRIELVRRHP